MTQAAVVLAAGQSRRFDGSVPKLLAPFRGRPLVGWAVDAAVGARLDETVVVTGATDLSALLPPRVTILSNQSWREGQASSVRTALDWCQRQGHQAVVLGLADQPLIPSSAWRSVAAADERPIAVATYDGRRRNPVRLDRSVWDLLDVSGDEGARSLMRRRPDLVTEVACDGEPADIDTVEELERWS